MLPIVFLHKFLLLRDTTKWFAILLSVYFVVIVIKVQVIFFTQKSFYTARIWMRCRITRNNKFLGSSLTFTALFNVVNLHGVYIYIHLYDTIL